MHIGLRRWLAERLPHIGVDFSAQLVRVLLRRGLTGFSGCFAPVEYAQQLGGQECGCGVLPLCPTAGPGYTGGWVGYGGQAVPLVPEFRCWGIVFNLTKGVYACVSTLHSAGMRAMWGMLGQCGTPIFRSLEVQVQLFEALVAPVLGFCSEVWAPGAILLCKCGTSAWIMIFIRFKFVRTVMRQALGGLRHSTPGGFCYGSLVVFLWRVLGSSLCSRPGIV